MKCITCLPYHHSNKQREGVSEREREKMMEGGQERQFAISIWEEKKEKKRRKKYDLY